MWKARNGLMDVVSMMEFVKEICLVLGACASTWRNQTTKGNNSFACISHQQTCNVCFILAQWFPYRILKNTLCDVGFSCMRYLSSQYSRRNELLF